jgi:hypothetical protein
MNRSLVYIVNRSLVFIVLVAVLFTACTTIKYVPIETVREISVHDTTYLHKTDTLVQIPEVSLSDFIDLNDTLIMRGTLSEARSWVDSTAMVLKGRLVQTGKIPVQIIEKERVVVKDSLITREIPIEVEKPVPYVPLFWKIMSTIGILALAAVALWLVFKFK